jgi:hypothetical protein
MNRRRAEADNPPVNSRITVVLLLFAASCWRLPERALLQQGQQVAHLPDRVASCCLLPRVVAGCCGLPRVVARKRQEEGKVAAGGSEVTRQASTRGWRVVRE